MVAWPTFWWTLAIAGFAAWMVVVVNQTAASMQSLMGSALGHELACDLILHQLHRPRAELA